MRFSELKAKNSIKKAETKSSADRKTKTHVRMSKYQGAP